MAIDIQREPSLTDIDSIHHHRPVQSSLTKHRRISISSIVHPDSLKIVLPTDEVTLKRHLGLFSGICFIVGVIIGSGIFVSPKGVLQETQSVGLCLIIWIACGLVALLGALCYAEIGAVIPRNGAEVAYIKEGIGSVHKQIGDILAYVSSWAYTFILKPSGIAILILTFSQYFWSGIIEECELSEELIKMTAIFAILMLININSISVSIANRLNIIFVICKVLTILTVIIIGVIRLGKGLFLIYTKFAKCIGTTKNPLGVALAFYSGLWAYDGWNSLNLVTEELKNPKRDLWLSIVLALPAVIILYVLTNISYFTVMNKATLLTSDAVAVTWGEVVLGPVLRFLPILISVSALGSANGSLFGAARFCMVSAQYGYLPEVFACIHIRRLTPIPAVVLQGVITILFCLPSNIDGLIDFFSFAAWIFYGLTFVATLCCKFTKKNAERVISVPIPLIIIIVLISIYLVLAPVITSPNIGYLFATIMILCGLVFYYPFVYRKIEWNIIILTIMAGEYRGVIDLHGKNAVITGASRGIGKEIALTLAKEGCNVALLARSRDALETLAIECSKNGIKAHVIICDMSSKQSIEDACKQISHIFQNKLDILINNAGIAGESVSAIEEKTPSGKDVVDMWEEVMMVNLLGLMRITGRCLPMMKESKHGAIITISSLSATMTSGRSAQYHASQWGVNGFLGSIYEDIREYGIKVCSIMPGFVNTPMIHDDKHKLNFDKCIQPEDIAQGVLYILRTPYNVCPTEIKYRPQYTPYLK
ncbi:unnamed protein product [Rotaria sordida]|uniref:b(0,+)-type amino acid transporter 1 n=1 Tax=Rotaria sordida TaxID=392033 RepID=A0A814I3S9_9BILA|nr:unnamed protein product [Rotaria sordida]